MSGFPSGVSPLSRFMSFLSHELLQFHPVVVPQRSEQEIPAAQQHRVDGRFVEEVGDNKPLLFNFAQSLVERFPNS